MKRVNQIDMFISLWKITFGYEPVDWSDAMKFKEATFPSIGINLDEIGITYFEDNGILVAIRATDGRYTQLAKTSEPVSIETIVENLERRYHGI